MDFIRDFSFFEDFDDCLTMDICHVHDFVEVDLFFFFFLEKKDCTDLFFLEYRFESISFTIMTMIPNLLRLAF